MPVNVKNIIPPKLAEGAQTTQYTSSNCKTLIDKFTGTNTHPTENVSLSVNLVPNGSSPATSNLIVSERVIYPGQTWAFPELVGHSLEPGGTISTLAGLGGYIVISASGREIT